MCPFIRRILILTLWFHWPQPLFSSDLLKEIADNVSMVETDQEGEVRRESGIRPRRNKFKSLVYLKVRDIKRRKEKEEIFHLPTHSKKYCNAQGQSLKPRASPRLRILVANIHFDRPCFCDRANQQWISQKWSSHEMNLLLHGIPVSYTVVITALV